MATEEETENRNVHTKKVKFNEQEDELESVFQKLRKKHGSEWSGPQHRLWARAIVSGEYDSQSPNAPIGLQKKPKESLVDAFAGTATAIAKALTPRRSVAATGYSVHFSPGEVDIQIKNFGAVMCFRKTAF